ncbi:MAG: hypothetical protein ABR881_04365 [Candidatus Sulfotelmatobacter sp.]|jgi:hypothetical protein
MLASADGRAEVAIAKGATGVTVTDAEAEVFELTLLISGPFLITWLAAVVAVMMTRVVLVTLGAVKTPVLEMVPALANQVTAVFEGPLMRAVNCTCSIDATVALAGESESAVEGAAPEVPAALCEAAPHAAVKPVRQSKSDKTTKFEIRFLSPR